jgi:hypothetical protein
MWRMGTEPSVSCLLPGPAWFVGVSWPRSPRRNTNWNCLPPMPRFARFLDVCRPNASCLTANSCDVSHMGLLRQTRGMERSRPRDHGAQRRDDAGLCPRRIDWFHEVWSVGEKMVARTRPRRTAPGRCWPLSQTDRLVPQSLERGRDDGREDATAPGVPALFARQRELHV